MVGAEGGFLFQFQSTSPSMTMEKIVARFAVRRGFRTALLRHNSFRSRAKRCQLAM